MAVGHRAGSQPSDQPGMRLNSWSAAFRCASRDSATIKAALPPWREGRLVRPPGTCLRVPGLLKGVWLLSPKLDAPSAAVPSTRK